MHTAAVVGMAVEAVAAVVATAYMVVAATVVDMTAKTVAAYIAAEVEAAYIAVEAAAVHMTAEVVAAAKQKHRKIDRIQKYSIFLCCKTYTA